jgi:serine/threonine protein kinase
MSVEGLSTGFKKRYELLKELGSGAMGSVHEARDATLNRTVAIKLLRIENTANAQKRFEAEAKVLAGLSHRRVLKVWDFGWDSDIPYIAMEYVQGNTLRKKMETIGTFEFPEFYRIALAILEGLSYVHSQSVLHRDLKPENILLDDEGGVFLADFGLAVPDRADRTRLTEMGMVVGTLRYIAPELLGLGDYSVKSDIYAVAVLLFEMLTAKVPFSTDSVQHMVGAKVSQDAITLRSVDTRFSEALSATIERGLARFPQDRYASTEEFARDLERCQRGRTTRPLAPIIPRRVSVPIRSEDIPEAAPARSRGPLIAAGAAALALAAFVALPGRAPKPDPSPIAVTSPSPSAAAPDGEVRTPRGASPEDAKALDALYRRIRELQARARALPKTAADLMLPAGAAKVAEVQDEGVACLEEALRLLEVGQMGAWDGRDWLIVDELLSDAIECLDRAKATRTRGKVKGLFERLGKWAARPARGPYGAILKHTLPAHVAMVGVNDAAVLQGHVQALTRADEALAAIQPSDWEIDAARLRLLQQRATLMERSVRRPTDALAGVDRNPEIWAAQKPLRGLILEVAGALAKALPAAGPRTPRHEQALVRVMYAAREHILRYGGDPVEVGHALALGRAACPLVAAADRTTEPMRPWIEALDAAAKPRNEPPLCAAR